MPDKNTDKNKNKDKDNDNDKDKNKKKDKDKDKIPEGNYEKGKKLFKTRCSQCHVPDKEETKTGPTLKGVIGRKSGTVPGFDYSSANKSKAVVWTRETLFDYLLNPKAYIPGTKMVFPGLKKAEERADLIAFLEKETAK